MSTDTTILAERSSDGSNLNTNWRTLVLRAYAVIVFAFVGFLSWAAWARLDNAAIGNGVVAVESNRKTVQHLEGGIVGEILVRDGDSVQEGDILVRLDPTRAEASAELYRRQLAALLAADARLVAERDNRDALEFPPEVKAKSHEPLVAQAIVDQQRQFVSRRDAMLGQTSILEAQVSQIDSEIKGLELQKATAEAQLVSVNDELKGLKELLAKNLVPLPRVTTMEREQLRLKGTIAQTTIDTAKAGQRIGEVRLKIAELRQERSNEASKLLPDTRKQISDIRQQLIVASDLLQRVEVRAPASGTIQQLRVFTVGGVIRAGEPILDIVPNSDELVVRAKLSPLDVHTVRPGLMAEVRFPALHRANVPFFLGTIRTLSKDRLQDEITREPYFAAEIIVDRKTIPTEIAAQLTAGLTADVIVSTGERTALQYLISPLMDRIHFAMRER